MNNVKCVRSVKLRILAYVLLPLLLSQVCVGHLMFIFVN
jgi:hypothetical protein